MSTLKKFALFFVFGIAVISLIGLVYMVFSGYPENKIWQAVIALFISSLVGYLLVRK